MNPSQLSRELRLGHSPDLDRRRGIIGLSMVGAAAGIVVGLYQTGIVKHLPDPPPHSLWDADRVDASDYAYSRMRSPDGFAMLTSYGITAWLASAGGMERATKVPLVPLAMGAKLLYDTALAVKLGREEWRDNRALCAYCQAATVASAVSVALALPEIARAARNLLGRGSGAGDGTTRTLRAAPTSAMAAA